MLAVVQVLEVEVKSLNIVVLFIVIGSCWPVLVSVSVNPPELALVICPIAVRFWTLPFEAVVGEVTVKDGVMLKLD